jgi:hypothetical protein
MPSSVMLCHVTLVRTDVSEERCASIIRVTRISEVGMLVVLFLHSIHQLLVTANIPSSLILVTLTIETVRSSETSVLTRATWRNIPEDHILHSHQREILKSYIQRNDLQHYHMHTGTHMISHTLTLKHTNACTCTHTHTHTHTQRLLI